MANNNLNYMKICKSRMLLSLCVVLFLTFFVNPAFGSNENYKNRAKFNISTSETKLTEVFRLVEKSSDFLFNYQDKDVANVFATVNVAGGTIDEVLSQALRGTTLEYIINDRHIVVARTIQTANNVVNQQATQKLSTKVVVSGVVTDKNNDALVGTLVVEKGVSNGVISAQDGRYKLSVENGATLVFSFMGFQNVEHKISGNTTLNVVMKDDILLISEVVVTALGIRREEKTLGYSLQEIESDAFQLIKTDNPLNRLNGKVAGLTVQTRAGILEDPSIKLRGENPIYVINGTPVQYYRGIANDDIESITVLKGAQAAALYGTLGADGAILITTKDGSNATEPMSVTVNSSTMFNAGFLTLPEQQTIYGTGDMGEYSYKDGKGGGLYDGLWTWGPKLDQLDPTSSSGWWETAQYNSPIDPKTGERIPTPWRSHKDNFRKFLELGFVTDNNVTVTNKFKNGSTRFSVNQMYRKGQTPNSDLNKMGANFALNYDLSSRLHVNANMNYSYIFTKNRQWSGYGNQHPYYNLLVYMGANNDVMDLRDYWEPGQQGYQQRSWNHIWFNNPWFVAYEYERPYSEPEFIGNFSIDYDLADGVNFLVRASHNSKEQRTDVHKPYAWVGNDFGQYEVTSLRNTRTDIDALLTYNKKFGRFGIDALFGGSYWQHEKAQVYASTNGGLQMPGLYHLSNSVLAPIPTPSKNFIERVRMASVFGTATINYNDFLYLTLTGRNDWSSKLVKENRSFFYPSASLSVILSEVINMPKEISLIKLRGSYAKIGRDVEDVYKLDYFYDFNQYWGSDNSGFIPAKTLIDPNIKPYFVTSYEVGFDARFFRNRLRMDFSYYYNLDEGKIEEVETANSSGYGLMLTNANDYIRYGWEVIIGGKPIKTQTWEWDISANWSLNRKRLHKIYNGESMFKNFKIGDRSDAIYEKVWLKDPDGNFVVTENNGRPIEDGFRRVIGFAMPNWELGISTSLRYKSWILRADFSGRFGGVVRSDLNARMIQAGTHKITANPARELDWSKSSSFIPGNAVIVVSGELEHDSMGNITSDTRIYAPSKTPMTYKAWVGYMGQLNGPYTMGYNLYAMDFIKLRSASISYDFSSLLTKQKIVRGLEVSVIGNNLWMWKKLLNEDPDANYKNFSYPTERMVGFNVKVTF